MEAVRSRLVVRLLSHVALSVSYIRSCSFLQHRFDLLYKQNVLVSVTQRRSLRLCSVSAQKFHASHTECYNFLFNKLKEAERHEAAEISTVTWNQIRGKDFWIWSQKKVLTKPIPTVNRHTFCDMRKWRNIQRNQKVSVHLMITIQWSDAQRLFDYPVFRSPGLYMKWFSSHKSKAK